LRNYPVFGNIMGYFGNIMGYNGFHLKPSKYGLLRACLKIRFDSTIGIGLAYLN